MSPASCPPVAWAWKGSGESGEGCGCHHKACTKQSKVSAALTEGMMMWLRPHSFHQTIAMQKNFLQIYTFFLKFFSIMVYHKILDKDLRAIQ